MKVMLLTATMDSDVFFGDDDVINDDPTTRKVASKLYNDGYRIGKAKEEEIQMQIGFDRGFERGMLSGRMCGRLYASCRDHISIHVNSAAEASTAMTALESILFAGIAEGGSITDDAVRKISSVVLSISTKLEPAVTLFTNEAKLLEDLR